MPRDPMPKKVRDSVLDEYNHRCAICGGDRPHLHHIDEDNSNNRIENILPLCPNCHLRDQHNPTRMIEVGKLQLFRRFKDPGILRPQFHPIFRRQLFLDSIELSDEPVRGLWEQVTELRELVKELEMGNFYFNRLGEILGLDFAYYQICLAVDPSPAIASDRAAGNRSYRAKLNRNRDAARELLVELLRYQRWANEA